jgi:tetratricopeptide (TPR) repeat protein
LGGQPILARPVGPAARAARWCRRNPAPAAVVAVSLLAAAIAGWAALTIAQQNRQLEAQNEQIVSQNRDILAQKEEIAAKEQLATAQKEEIAAKERRATALLSRHRDLVNAFAVEVPRLTDNRPFCEEVAAELRNLVVRLLGGTQEQADVGTLNERGLLILATRNGDQARMEKRLDAAGRHYQEALRIAQSVAEKETTEKDKAASNVSFAWIKMAELAIDRHQFGEAVGHYTRALELRRRIVNEPQTGDIDPADAKKDYGEAYILLAEARHRANDPKGALEAAVAGLKILEECAPAVRGNQRARARRDLAHAAHTVGNLAYRARDDKQGRASFDRAITILGEERGADPTSASLRYDLAQAANDYGDWLLVRRPAEALKYFQMAQEANRSLCDDRSVVNVMQKGLALGYWRLGRAPTWPARSPTPGSTSTAASTCAKFDSAKSKKAGAGSQPAHECS